METITLPKGCRNRFYFPIIMPLNKDGMGPCSNNEIVKIVWEVWGQDCSSYGSYEFLPDAIDKAEELNAHLLQEL